MIFDLIILLIIAGYAYLGYKYGTSKELYRLAKIFAGLSIAGAYASTFGKFLTTIGLLRANDLAVLNLSGFLLLFIIYWTLIYFIEKAFVKADLKKSALDRYFGLASNAIQALFIITFISFMSTQLSFTNKEYKAYLVTHSFSYIHMDRACRKVITASFVKSITDDNSAASTSKMIQHITR